jgi:hypothetical protein
MSGTAARLNIVPIDTLSVTERKEFINEPTLRRLRTGPKELYRMY